MPQAGHVEARNAEPANSRRCRSRRDDLEAEHNVTVSGADQDLFQLRAIPQRVTLVSVGRVQPDAPHLSGILEGPVDLEERDRRHARAGMLALLQEHRQVDLVMPRFRNLEQQAWSRTRRGP